MSISRNFSVYDEYFEFNFGLAYRCSECTTLNMKAKDFETRCNKKISKTSNKVIEETDIRKINNSLEHVSFIRIYIIWRRSKLSILRYTHIVWQYLRWNIISCRNWWWWCWRKNSNTSKSNDELKESVKHSSINEQC